MKVPRSIRELHRDLSVKYAPLKRDVDQLLSGRRDSSWHYESRLKDVNSFALKLESGRWKRLSDIDDLFAAVLVVQNLSGIDAAARLVRDEFDVVRRRPRSRDWTNTKAESFPFDDTRFYVRWRSESSVPKPEYDGLMFEIQLRTYLQHAWNVATHDSVYKSQTMEWPKERLAAQVRASLEQAEVVLHEIDTLSQSRVLRRTDTATQRVATVTKLLARRWESHRLPEDIKRLSMNVLGLIDAIGISVSRLREILQEEEAAGRGSRTENLSPYGAIVQSLIRREPSATKRMLCSKDREFAIWIPSEIDVPKEMEEEGGFHDVIVLR